MSFKPKVAETQKKGMHPAWRAVGFVLIFFVFGTSFMAAQYALDWLNNGSNYNRVASMNASLPYLLSTMRGVQPSWMVSLGLALIISLFFFAFLTLAWAFVRDDSEQKKEVRLSDVAKMYNKKRKNVRKCR